MTSIYRQPALLYRNNFNLHKLQLLMRLIIVYSVYCRPPIDNRVLVISPTRWYKPDCPSRRRYTVERFDEFALTYVAVDEAVLNKSSRSCVWSGALLWQLDRINKIHGKSPTWSNLHRSENLSCGLPLGGWMLATTAFVYRAHRVWRGRQQL